MCNCPARGALSRLCDVREKRLRIPWQSDRRQTISGPKNVKDARVFLCLAPFYRRMVPNFAEIAKALTVLTRKDRQFAWGRKSNRISRVWRIGCIPRPYWPTKVLNCSSYKLLTLQKWSLSPSCRKSKTEKSGRSHTQIGNITQRNKIIVSVQEMLDLVWATTYFRCYLYGKRFLVRTDHAALTYLQKFVDHNSRLLR